MNINKQTLDYILQLATGIKNIEADRLSHFDYSDVIKSNDISWKVSDSGELMSAHFQLRILNEDKEINTLQLEYVPIKEGEKYYELDAQQLRQQRTIYNLPLVIQELNNAGYKWSYKERFHA